MFLERLNSDIEKDRALISDDELEEEKDQLLDREHRLSVSFVQNPYQNDPDQIAIVESQYLQNAHKE